MTAHGPNPTVEEPLQSRSPPPPAPRSLFRLQTHLQYPSRRRNIRFTSPPPSWMRQRKDGEELLRSLHSALEGLTKAKAEERARTSGPNEVAQERQRGWSIRILIIIRNPLVILLASVSDLFCYRRRPRRNRHGGHGGAECDASILAGSSRRRSSGKAQGHDPCNGHGVRDGKAREIPLRDLVPGDIIKLAAGDMIPGDVRVVSAKDLFVSQGALPANRFPSRSSTSRNRNRELADRTQEHVLHGNQR